MDQLMQSPVQEIIDGMQTYRRLAEAARKPHKYLPEYIQGVVDEAMHMPQFLVDREVAGYVTKLHKHLSYERPG